MKIRALTAISVPSMVFAATFAAALCIAAPAFAEDKGAVSCAEFLTYNPQQKIGFLTGSGLGGADMKARDQIKLIEAYCAENPDGTIGGAFSDG